MRKVKTYTIVFAACTLWSGACAAGGQDTTVPFSLNISTQTPIIKSGGHLTIKITQKNTSKTSEDCSAQIAGGVDISYNYAVLDENGKALEERDIRAYSGSFQPCTLLPNDAVSEFAPIHVLFDLSVPGKYTIQVSRSLLAGGVIQSNKLPITVTE
jgi:hypothetical protein